MAAVGDAAGEAVPAAVPVAAVVGEVAGVAVWPPFPSAGAESPSPSLRAKTAHQLAMATTATTLAPMAPRRTHRELEDCRLPGCCAATGCPSHGRYADATAEQEPDHGRVGPSSGAFGRQANRGAQPAMVAVPLPLAAVRAVLKLPGGVHARAWRRCQALARGAGGTLTWKRRPESPVKRTVRRAAIRDPGATLSLSRQHRRRRIAAAQHRVAGRMAKCGDNFWRVVWRYSQAWR